MYTRQHYHELTEASLVEIQTPIQTRQGEGSATRVRLFDGSVVTLRSTTEDYDPTDRNGAYGHLSTLRDAGEVATGLLYLEENDSDMHSMAGTTSVDLVDVPYEDLCPGAAALDSLMAEFR
jgi:2-oxoglutarate/2-oxoacid ferredoxin oxidoreductase subunit beta